MNRSEALRGAGLLDRSPTITPPLKVALRSTESRERTYTVYVHERGKKPRLTPVQVVGKIPSTISDSDRTFYWVSADLSARTLTYTDIKPAVAG